MNEPDPDDCQYPPEEAQRRFEAIARAVANAPPMPQKDVPRKERGVKPETPTVARRRTDR